MAPSPEHPLSGRCACGGVRFEVTTPFTSARYCHCHRCQQRTGTASSANAQVGAEGFRLVAGEELLRCWQPPDGFGKWYCVACGGHVYSASPDLDLFNVRLGALEGDPGIRPQCRQWLSSAASWEPIPDDGLPRYDESAPPGWQAALER